MEIAKLATTKKRRVFINQIRPQDIPQGSHGMKLGIVRVFDEATGKPANLGGIIFPTRIQGIPQVFQSNSTYVIAPPTQMQSFAAAFFESNGFEVVAKPARYKV